MAARIEPLEPPFGTDVADVLAAMMPPGVPPIALFRTFAHNLEMSHALVGWGGYELSERLTLSMRHREIVIDRTCARCGCEYEWGVHVAFFASRVALTNAEVLSLTSGFAADPCWSDPAERLLIEAADQLHDTATVTASLLDALSVHFDDAQLLDLFMLAGWYHAISFAANAARVPLEPEAPRFGDFAP